MRPIRRACAKQIAHYRSDSKGIEVGGQFKATLASRLYTLHISVKDNQAKKTAQQTVDFEVTS
jgi:hypothetical protein